MQLRCFYGEHKVRVRLEINDVARPEFIAAGVGVIILVGRHKRTCTDGYFYVSLRLNYLALEFAACVFYAKLIVRNIDYNVRTVTRFRSVIMRGGNGKAEVINCLGVGTVYGNLQYVVFIRIRRYAVGIVRMCYRVRIRRTVVVCERNGGLRARMTKGYDTRNVGITQGIPVHIFVENYVRRFRRVDRRQRTRRSPSRKNIQKCGVDIIVIHSVNRGFFRRVRSYDFRTRKLNNLRFIVLTGVFRVFCIFGLNIPFVQEEFEYVVRQIAYPFVIGSRR